MSLTAVTMPSLKSLLSLLPFAVGVLSGSLADYPPDDVDSGKVLSDLSKKAFDNAMKRLEETGTPECNVDNVRIHKEWYVDKTEANISSLIDIRS